MGHLHVCTGVCRRRRWHPTPVLLPGKSPGQRSPVGYSPSDTTEWRHFHFSHSCIGERNGNPLQCSCLENPRDGEAWWAAIYGVAQSRTQLKRLSSSSSSTGVYAATIFIIHHYLAKVYAIAKSSVKTSPSSHQPTFFFPFPIRKIVSIFDKLRISVI